MNWGGFGGFGFPGFGGFGGFGFPGFGGFGFPGIGPWGTFAGSAAAFVPSTTIATTPAVW